MRRLRWKCRATMQVSVTAVPPKYSSPEVAPHSYDGHPSTTITARYTNRTSGINIDRKGYVVFAEFFILGFLKNLCVCLTENGIRQHVVLSPSSTRI